jgi:general secretion pathway protein G
MPKGCVPWRRVRRGFTLVELLVVIVVLGLLAGLIGPQLFGRVGEARATTARTQMSLLATALDGYRLDTGGYPTTRQGLEALWTKPTQAPIPAMWRGPYLRQPVPMDPWGRPYVYQAPVAGPEGFALRTLGKDGAPGGTGDDADLSHTPVANARR